MEQFKEILDKYPKRIILARVNGRFIHPSEGTISYEHRINHQIVSLADNEYNPSDLFIFDTQESCVSRLFYCAKDDNDISVSHFKPEFSLEAIDCKLIETGEVAVFYKMIFRCLICWRSKI